MKIQKLTKKQRLNLEVYKNKWLDIGLSTSRIDKEKNNYWINKMYEISDLEKPKKILYFNSPISCILGYLFLNKVGPQVKGQAKAQVRDEIAAQVAAQVRNEAGDQVWAQVWTQVWAQVRDQFRDQIRDQIEDQVGNFIYGSMDAYWLCFYDYFLENFNLDCCKKLKPMIEISKNCGWILPYKNIALCSEKPTEIHFNTKKQLHNEIGPSISYEDGFSIYSLNGVRVTKEIVETPANKLNCNLILKEKNSEIRRELVRKIGIERICKDLKAKCIDRKDNYELLNLDLGENNLKPYLKMINPSLKVYHIEGVHPDCNTVEKALIWRNNNIKEQPLILT